MQKPVTAPHWPRLRVTPSQAVSALSIVVSACAAIAGAARQISPAHAGEIGIACTVLSSVCRSLMGGLSTGQATGTPPNIGQAAPNIGGIPQ